MLSIVQSSRIVRGILHDHAAGLKQMAKSNPIDYRRLLGVLNGDPQFWASAATSAFQDLGPPRKVLPGQNKLVALREEYDPEMPNTKLLAYECLVEAHREYKFFGSTYFDLDEVRAQIPEHFWVTVSELKLEPGEHITCATGEPCKALLNRITELVKNQRSGVAARPEEPDEPIDENDE